MSESDIRCWNCGRKIGEVKQGNIYVAATTNLKETEIESDYVEETECRKCHKMNTKILIK